MRFCVRTERCADGRLWCIVTDTAQRAPLPPSPDRAFTYSLGDLWSTTTSATVVLVPPEVVALVPLVLTARSDDDAARALVVPALGWGLGFGQEPSHPDGADFAGTLIAAHHQSALFAAVSAIVQNVEHAAGTDADILDAADDVRRVLALLPGDVPPADRVVWCVVRLFGDATRVALLRHLSAPIETRPGVVPQARGERGPAITRTGNTAVDASLVMPRRLTKDGAETVLGFGTAALDALVSYVARVSWRRLDEPLWDQARPPSPPSPYEVLRLRVEIAGEPGHGPAVTDAAMRALATRLAQRPDVGGVLCGWADCAELDAVACVGFLAVRFFLQGAPCEALAQIPVGVWASMLAQPYPAVIGVTQEACESARKADGRVMDPDVEGALRVGARWAFGPCGKWACRAVSPQEIRTALAGAAAVPSLDELRAWVVSTDSPETRALFAALEHVVEQDGERAMAAMVELWTGTERGRLPAGGLTRLRPRGTVSVGPNFVAHQCAHQIDVPTGWLNPAALPREETGPLLRSALFHGPTTFGFA